MGGIDDVAVAEEKELVVLAQPVKDVGNAWVEVDDEAVPDVLELVVSELAMEYLAHIVPELGRGDFAPVERFHAAFTIKGHIGVFGADALLVEAFVDAIHVDLQKGAAEVDDEVPDHGVVAWIVH